MKINLFKIIKNLTFQLLFKTGSKISKNRVVFLFTNTDCLVKYNSNTNHEIFRFSALEEIPELVMKNILNQFDNNYFKLMSERFSENARLYVLLIDGEFGSLGWIKSGCDIPVWLTELKKDDFVMFAAYTNPRLRGRHLWGYIIATAYRYESKSGARYLADCNVTNIPSRRQLERSGFEVLCRTQAPT